MPWGIPLTSPEFLALRLLVYILPLAPARCLSGGAPSKAQIAASPVMRFRKLILLVSYLIIQHWFQNRSVALQHLVYCNPSVSLAVTLATPFELPC